MRGPDETTGYSRKRGSSRPAVSSGRTLVEIISGRDADALIEVRCRRPSDGIIAAREWFPLGDECLRFIDSRATAHDVYVGVAPRCERGGGKASIRHAWCLWVDCDTSEAVERLAGFTPRPSLVVLSGSGDNRHAYWRLSEPLAPAWVERANRRLAHRLGADQRATDVARILRPPATFNHKHDPPVLVSAEVGPSDAYTVASLVADLPDPPNVRPSVAPRDDFDRDDPLDRIPAEHYYTRLTGRPITRGNVTCPFHNDGNERTPSMRLYDTTWYCFGCGQGGSVFEFGAALWGMGTRGTDFLALKERLTDALG